ncbi:nuclear transport factor 2 family protein [Pedobacter cryotolerans]|uniref:Nuclear transport factor 2 family protein n=1 Tax=Pedobacter cryotolerans TaxID=2571270 RepID=A0A4U1CA96_9SPHI|nr:nuclear transport factor 2 family protein [Pedobacter cryotolerans]TKC02715.1 nuclear transport factor 2 family protein [Pedobacter cryotolerans]
MKKIILLLVLSLSMMVKAQSRDENEVLAAVENMRLALISGEKTALENVAATDLSYGHSSGKIQEKAAFVEAIANGSSDFVSVEFKNQTVKISGKTAIVRHELHAVTNDGGKPGEAHIGVMLVWQKQGKTWKLLGRQAFKLPV